MSGLQVGLCVLPADVRSVVRFAEAAEHAGVSRLGICDSPYAFADPHAAIQAALRATSTMGVGTLVTNPVTRHWSVQAAAFRTLDEIGPGRVFMGIGTGDTAVLEVGLRPARLRELADYVQSFRTRVPRSVPVVVAAGGPGSVRRAAAYADEIVIGQGASPESFSELGAVADAVRAEQGEPALPRWAFFILGLATSEDQVRAVVRDLRPIVVGQARQSFAGTFEAKGVSPEYQELLPLFFQDFDRDAAERRALSPADTERLEEFLFARFALVGTPEDVGQRLLRHAADMRFDRAFLALVSSDPERELALACSRMLPRLASLEAGRARPPERSSSHA